MAKILNNYSGSYDELVEKVKKVLAENGLEAMITPGAIYQPEGGEKRISLHLEFEQKVGGEIMQKLEAL